MAKSSLEKRLDFETLISDLSARFINLPVDRIDEAIEKGQKLVCDALGFHASGLCEFTPDKTALILRHCWHPEATDYTNQLRNLKPDHVAAMWEKLSTEKLIAFSDYRLLQDDHLRIDVERVKRICKETGIRGLYIFPLQVGESDIGTISWESHHHPLTLDPALVNRLRLVSEVFSNALSRKRTETALRVSIREIQKLKDRLEQENVYLIDEACAEYCQHDIIGKSRAVRKVVGQIEEVAETEATVLILGETGTGKELVARAIHNASSRKDRPMVKLNCSALPETLIESELFGHEKGAFSGAVAEKPGRFEVADESTIFLDEIGDMPLSLQPKLLRVLQEGQFERLGSVVPKDVNTRVIAATNRDLEKAVRQGRFRKDLYYRLNVFPITIPPLRERLADIPLLVGAFVAEFSARMNKTINSIPNDAITALQRYGWPGNVRELRNMVERAMIISKGTTLRIQLPEIGDDGVSAVETLDQVQRSHILRVLKKCGGRISGDRGASTLLGINESTLRSRMKKLGIRHQRKYS